MKHMKEHETQTSNILAAKTDANETLYTSRLFLKAFKESYSLPASVIKDL